MKILLLLVHSYNTFLKYKSATTYLCTFVCCLILSLCTNQGFAQQKRLKVGLVLSGGGAKGFAHIGVLHEIEKAGIKIDYIGGTSMGAVIGGLYATGYSATQIDSIFAATNFQELLQDYIPRTSKSFYEKRNDELYAIALPFNKFKLGVPLALSKGIYNYNMLTNLTQNVRKIRDFSKLPIPFLCIASNIETGEQVLLNKGCLPEAILASSAFPSLFSPVIINGKMLIDGGVTNNYPIAEVKKMGADIIIGVDVQDDLKDRNYLTEATRILVQISNFAMANRMKDKVGLTDIYIKPEVSEYSVISFAEGKEIIQKGHDAALLVKDKLMQLGDLSSYKQQSLKFKSDSLNLQQIVINDIKNYTRAYVIGKLGFKQGSTISFHEFKNGINKLNATQNFKSINYELSDTNNNTDKLQLNLVESKNRTFLKFGLHYDGLYKSAILANLTQKKLLFKNDILSIDVGLGDNFRYNLDYYIDNGFYFSFGVKSRLNQFNKNVASDFSNGNLLLQLGINTINIDFFDFTNQMYLQTIFEQKFQIGAGIEHKFLKIQSNTLGTSNNTFENNDYLSLFGNIKYDSFDDKFFPKKGWGFNGDIQTYLFSTDYSNQFNRFSIVKADAGIAQTFFKKYTLKLQSDIGFVAGQKSISFFDFILGGYGFSTINNFKQFYGYDFLSLAGNSYLKTMATIDVEIINKNHLNFAANFANIQDNLFEKVNFITVPKYSGYAFGYGLETPVGPVEVKYSWSPELPKGFIFISAGFWF
jgi:NTE family protein